MKIRFSSKFGSKPITVSALLLLVLCFVFKAPICAQTTPGYRFKYLTTFYSDVTGISNAQVVVGNVYDAPEFSGSDGLVGDLTTGSYSKNRKKFRSFDFYNAVNTSNVIVGAGGVDNSYIYSQAFSLRNGVYTILYPKGSGGAATSSEALGINDHGVIVGRFDDRLGQHGFILQDGAYTVLDVPGMSKTLAYGINNLGVVTVQATASDGHVNSYLYQNGTYTLLNVPGALNSYIRGINDFGTIVFGYGPNNQSKVYKNGQFTDLTGPGGISTFAIGINNAGVISGNAGFYDVFVAYPTR